MHVQAADGKVAVERGDGVLAADFDQIAVRHPAGESKLQFLPIVALGSELADELLESGARMREPGDMLDQGGVGHTYMQRYGTALRQTLATTGGARMYRL